MNCTKPVSLIRMLLTLGVLLSAGFAGVSASTASASATITLTVERYVLVTQMKVTPQTLNLKQCDDKGNGKNKGNNDDNSNDLPLHIMLYIPDCMDNLALHTETITLNGVLIPLRSSPPGYDPATDPPPQGGHFMHLFFDRQEVINRLHLTDGNDIITLEAEITGGNMITAADTVKVIH